MAETVRKPALSRLLRELLDVPKVIAAPLRGAASVPHTGKGEPVLVIPGFLADDAATSVLRKSLKSAGYRAFGWRLGFNLGFRDNLVDRMVARLEAVHAECGQKVVLIGWSLVGSMRANWRGCGLTSSGW
ncbi:hypothetical protein OKA06_13960 [Novosphingobium sp. MW5]|nr:hypothetical protein [Novosphingobium sp. MW5]